MDLMEEVLEMKREVKDIEEENFALEILHDYKQQNKRLFIIWIVTFIALIGVTCYTIYLLNDIGTVEEITTVDQDASSGDNSVITQNGIDE